MLPSMEKTGGKLSQGKALGTQRFRGVREATAKNTDRWATRVRKELERVVRTYSHLTGPHTKERWVRGSY